MSFVEPKHTICDTGSCYTNYDIKPGSGSTMMWKILARTLRCKETPSCDTHNAGRVNEDESKFAVNEDWQVFRLASFLIRGKYDT